MEEDFEKYIRENRNQLDDIEPVDELAIWQGISNNEAPAKAVKRQWSSRHLIMAASVLFMLGFGLAYLLLPSTQKANQDLLIAQLLPEMAQEEAQYIRLIQEKEKAVQITQLDTTKYAHIFNDLAQLENIQQEYRKDILPIGPDEQLIETLLKYYEQKIRILERLSKEIEINEKDHEKYRQEQHI